MVVCDLALHIDAKDALTLQKDLLQLSTDADFSFRDWVIVGTGSHKFWIKRRMLHKIKRLIGPCVVF